MCQAVLSPNLTKKFQWEVSQIANNRFPLVMLLGGLSVNLNHLKRKKIKMSKENIENLIEVLNSSSSAGINKCMQILKGVQDNSHDPHNVTDSQLREEHNVNNEKGQDVVISSHRCACQHDCGCKL